jgi:nucleotide-binding universal stress UspA family protein
MALESVLVPYDGSAEADALLRFACEVVTGKRRVIALYAERVPPSLPLDPLPASFDLEGNRALNHAETLAWHHGVSIETTLTRVRHVADAIVGEARLEGVDAIFIPLGKRRWPWQAWLLPSMVRAVMRRAPCPVLLGPQATLCYELPLSPAAPENEADALSPRKQDVILRFSG